MEFKISSVFRGIRRCAIGVTRCLSNASYARFKVRASATCCAPTNYQLHQLRSVISTRFFLPNAVSHRILHVTSKLNQGAEKSDPTESKDSHSRSGVDGQPHSTPKGQESSLGEDDPESKNADDKPLGLFQRFKETYKQHGKVLIGVHLFTSCIWATSFYCAAICGIEVVPFLKWLGFGDKILAPFAVPGVGHAAVTYLMYKLATPLRYTVTIAGTRLAVNILRKRGHLPTMQDENRIRSFVKEGQQKMKAKYEDVRKRSDET